MQNENGKSAISTNDIQNSEISIIETANISNIANVATSASNTFSQKIGRTTYNVQVFFSKTSRETFNDKILRLIKHDIATEAKGA